MIWFLTIDGVGRLYAQSTLSGSDIAVAILAFPATVVDANGVGVETQ